MYHFFHAKDIFNPDMPCPKRHLCKISHKSNTSPLTCYVQAAMETAVEVGERAEWMELNLDCLLQPIRADISLWNFQDEANPWNGFLFIYALSHFYYIYK